MAMSSLITIELVWSHATVGVNVACPTLRLAAHNDPVTPSSCAVLFPCDVRMGNEVVQRIHGRALA
jgi:hypothetical protein